MAIYERDREFHKIFDEIEVGIIPLKFVRDITCFLKDGTNIILTVDDFDKFAPDAKHIEHLVRDLPFYDRLTDLNIRIDYDLVEEDVSKKVAKILDIK